MLKAVLALTKTPQNNLRIFKVGAKKKEMKTLNDLVLLLVIHRRDSYLDWVLGGAQDGNLVFAEECQTNLMDILKEWFHDDTRTADDSL